MRRMLRQGSFRCVYDEMGRPVHFRLLAQLPLRRMLRLSEIETLRVRFRGVMIPAGRIELHVDGGVFSPGSLPAQIDRYWARGETACVEVRMPPGFRVDPCDTAELELRLRGGRTLRDAVFCVP